MPAFLRALKNLLLHANANQDPLLSLPSFTDVILTSRALQFTCDGFDIDIMVTHDWKSDTVGGGGGGGAYTSLYDASCNEESDRARQWQVISNKIN